MKAEKIQPGYRFGNLVVTRRAQGSKNGYALWECRCDCGKTVIMDSRWIRRGTRTDCGCKNKVQGNQKDLTGRTFGRLTVLHPTARRQYGCVVWKCKCACGKQVEVASRQLLQGNVKSCGCLGHPPLKDLVGEKFGHLRVIAYAGKHGGMHRWKCKCDCGNEAIVGQSLLQSGKTTSCGCVRSKKMKEKLKLIDHTSVTLLEGGRNHISANNTSGVTGVYKNKKTGKWIAQITFKRKTYYLGSYSDFDQAVKARKQGEVMHEDFLAWYYATHPEAVAANSYTDPDSSHAVHMKSEVGF